MKHLQVACLHFKVTYGEVERNKRELLSLLRQEAEQGVHIIVTPEMSISGYSFTSRADILPLTITQTDDFVVQVHELAAEFGCYIFLGAAVRVPPEDIVYNSTLVIGPEGRVLRYDKVNGEIRWSCPGAPVQDNVVLTPWGKIGVLICSDSYFELMARAAALKGADLLLVPATWPSSGLDPVEVWQARAMENGIHVIGCNRTGNDIRMDCSSAQSAWVTPEGKVRQRYRSRETFVLRAALPLQEGKLDCSLRQKRLSTRRPEHYHSIYRSLGAIQDLTSFYEMPEPGKLDIFCFVPEPSGDVSGAQQLLKGSAQTPTLCVLPELSIDPKDLARQLGITGRKATWMFFRQHHDQRWILVSADGAVNLCTLARQDTVPWEIIDFGPVRLGIIDASALWHPEVTVSLSKEGCDLIALSSKQDFTEEMKLLAGARTINHLAVAVCCRNGGGIWMRPEGHGRWQEQLVEQTGFCSFTLDTSQTRKKRFQDRVDFKTLLKNNTMKRG